MLFGYILEHYVAHLIFKTGQQNSNQLKFPASVSALTTLVCEVVQFTLGNGSKTMLKNKLLLYLLIVAVLCLWTIEAAPQIKTFFSVYSHRPYFGDAGVASYDVKYFGTFGSPNSFGEHF
ncbi:hypothetical protein Zmor_006191 [Zophobas morio]|uniref:Uncharacterized protein n=1 Tax=Zophobas morio TaxID=2755281 RepID=A0AA38MMQ2_9CUCU|nr:hypothetical protein Zmor_006191 [Zophobas morio]